jgi:nucleoside-diphosphate-sugar epimerase
VRSALIAGITGFLGSHLARHLVREGWEVRGLKRAGSPTWRLGDLARQIVFHDVEHDPLESYLPAKRPPDVVFYLATVYGKATELPSAVLNVNTMVPLRLLERAREVGVAAFIHSDTCYTLAYRHLQAYTLSKQQLVAWGRLLADEATRFINVKLQHPYGPMDAFHKFVPTIIRQCLESETIPLTLGEQRKDFVYITDVVQAFATIAGSLDQLEPGFMEFECGSGTAVSIRTFVETVHRLVRSRAQLQFGALPYRDNEIMFSQARIKALKNLGWRPTTSLAEGLRRTLAEDYLITPAKKEAPIHAVFVR